MCSFKDAAGVSVSWYLNDDGGAFIHCDHSVVMGPSEHLQGRTVAPLQHCYIKPAAQHKRTQTCFTIWHLNDAKA